MAPDGIRQRVQQRGRLADPVGQRGTSRSSSSRPKIRLRRHKGRWPAYPLTSTWARGPGPGRPRSMGREGGGAWTNRAQQAQVGRGRTIRFTMKRPGTYSSSSATSWPIRRRRPPQPAQASAPGAEFHLHPGNVVRDRTAPGSVFLLDVRQAHPRGQSCKALAHVGDARRQPPGGRPEPGSRRQAPDQPGQRLGITAAADPHPMPGSQFDLDVTVGDRRSDCRLRFRDDLHRKKAGSAAADGTDAGSGA